MKVVRIQTNTGLQIPVARFETHEELAKHVNGDLSKIVEICSNYGQQKDALVDGREWVSEQIATLFKFPRLTKTVDVDGTPTQVDDDTDNEHIKRFINEVAAGKFGAELVKATTVDARVLEATKLLQDLIDKRPEGPFTMNLNASQRVSKPKEPAVYALDAAQKIIAAGKAVVDTWIGRFTKGHAGVPPTAFEAFNTAPAKGATPEQVEATNKQNVRNLAFAIMAREKAKADMAKAEYAA